MSDGRLASMIVIHDGQRGHADVSVAAIGVFDGLHLGHQKVLGEVVGLAREHGVVAAVVTFDPHPALILAPERAPLQIGTLDQRLEGMAALGIDVVRLITFDHELAHESAHDFVQRVLLGELRVHDVVVGEDFVFGHDREGDVALLRHEGELHNFHVLAAPIYGEGHRWSSTAVRRALSEGDLERANAMLGRPFTLRGVVGHGDARGAQLGFPTANLVGAPRQQLPSQGVYAGAVRTTSGEWWPGAISVGQRPQFYADGDLLVEVHLVGFDHDLYDQSLDVCFLARLRGQESFASTQELIEQIDRDVSETLENFKKFDPSSSTLLG